MRIFLRSLLAIVLLLAIALTVSYFVSGGPTDISNHVHIKKPKVEVFSYISDMRNELKWNPDVLYMQKITGGDVGKGTQFKAKWHMSDTLIETITDFEPSDRVAFYNGGPLEVKLNAQLTPAEDGTNMETHFVVTPHGFIRALFPIIKLQLQKQEKENMVNLEKALDK